MISKKDMADFLKSAKAITGKKMNLNILKSLLLTVDGENVNMAVTDLDNGLVVALQGEISRNPDAVKVCIPVDNLLKIVKASKESEITIDIIENQYARINDSVTIFDCPDAEEYPEFPSVEGETGLEINLDIDKLKKINLPVYAGEMREHLKNILIDTKKGLAVSTDGHRLFAAKINTYGNIEPFMYPRSLVKLLSGIKQYTGSAAIIADNNHLFSTLENGYVVTRLVDADFPNYETVIDNEVGGRLVLDKPDDLFDLIKETETLLSAEYKSIEIRLNGRVEISAVNPAIGKFKKELTGSYEYDGPENATINLNARFVSELKRFLKDTRELKFTCHNEKENDFNGPVLTDDGEYITATMPVRA